MLSSNKYVTKSKRNTQFHKINTEKRINVYTKELALVIGYMFGLYIDPNTIKTVSDFNRNVIYTFRQNKMSGLVNTMYASLLKYLIVKKEYTLYAFVKNILYSSHSKASIANIMKQTKISDEDDRDIYSTGDYIRKTYIYSPENTITNDLLIITNLEYRTGYTNMTIGIQE